MRRVVIAVVVGIVLAANGPVRGMDDELHDSEPGPAASLGWGMAAIGTNLGYIPAKMLYALGGGLVGLMAWGVTAGDDQALDQLGRGLAVAGIDADQRAAVRALALEVAGRAQRVGHPLVHRGRERLDLDRARVGAQGQRIPGRGQLITRARGREVVQMAWTELAL